MIQSCVSPSVVKTDIIFRDDNKKRWSEVQTDMTKTDESDDHGYSDSGIKEGVMTIWKKEMIPWMNDGMFRQEGDDLDLSCQVMHAFLILTDWTFVVDGVTRMTTMTHHHHVSLIFHWIKITKRFTSKKTTKETSHGDDDDADDHDVPSSITPSHIFLL